MYQYMKNYSVKKKTFLDWKVEPQPASVLNQSLLTEAKLFCINAVSHLQSSFIDAEGGA